MELSLNGLEGRDRLAVADRQMRQFRMLSPVGDDRPRVAVQQGESAQDVVELARSLGVVVAREPTRSGSTIPDEWRVRGFTVSVIVACHNYGHYLGEAVESVLAQTYLPDEILLSDDASTDDSAEIMMKFAREHPNLIRVHVNSANLGINRHFNEAVSSTTGDVVMILGADNRIPAHYVESCLAAIVGDRNVAIAYTDFALFGSRATAIHASLRDSFRGSKLDYGVRLSNFPEFDVEARSILDSGLNFLHGSSMYRRDAFEAVGGYGSRTDGPEDMQLFQSMINTGWEAKKVPGVYLEYRQHSADQANMQFSLYRELYALRREVGSLRQEVSSQLRQIESERRERALLQEDNERLRSFVDRVRESAPYRALRVISAPWRRLRKRT